MKKIFLSILCSAFILSPQAQEEEEASGKSKRSYSQAFGSKELPAQKHPKSLIEKDTNRPAINFNDYNEIVDYILSFLTLPKNDPTPQAVIDLVHVRRVSQQFNGLAQHLFFNRQAKNHKEFTFTCPSNFQDNFLFFTSDFVNVCPHIDSILINPADEGWTTYNLEILMRHHDRLKSFQKVTKLAINIGCYNNDLENNPRLATFSIGDDMLNLMKDFRNLNQLKLEVSSDFFLYAPASYEALTNLTRLKKLSISIPHHDISPLGKLTNLTALRINNNIEVNAPLNFLTPLTNLISLGLSYMQCYNGVHTLAPLARLTNLTKLDLRDNYIKNILQASINDVTPVPGFTRHLLPLVKLKKIESDIKDLPQLGSDGCQMMYSKEFPAQWPPEQFLFAEDIANWHLLDQRMSDNIAREKLKS